ncbi:MAG: monofunctional biosynthetic peptidoglycan transglycosylase, partial [Deltaproteobacteria bacterium]|nr:monofunctional biosynthetic peptidoglycan transglycosylase [Deltaproteobacteria bacterium]
MSMMRRFWLGMGGVAAVLLLYFTLTLPDVSTLKKQNPVTTAFMVRDPGLPLQIWVPYHQISPYLKEAVVLAEDARFFQHGGFDLRAIWEAVKRNWKEKEWKWGGSTITQQLAKNLYLNPSKNPMRKIREILIAWRLERHLSKQRILELYLNVVEWGKGIYGIEAAALHYFGVAASQLSPAQAAKLAAILPSPRYFQQNFHSPFLEQKAA